MARLLSIHTLLMLILSASSHALPLQQRDNSTLPVNFAYILYPGFANIDVFAPVDALQFLSYQYPMNLYFLSDTLDPVTTNAISASANPYNSSVGSTILPTHTFSSPPPSGIDVLLVPGGVGTFAPTSALDAHIAFINATYPSLQYFISICTGQELSGLAGVLADKAATTNKQAWNETIAYSPTTAWKAPARWWADGNVWTTSGESAGLDGVLGWIGRVYGQDVAAQLGVDMEHQPLDWWEDEFSAINDVNRTYPCGEAPEGFEAPPQCEYGGPSR